MTQYIKKSDVVAEIERLITELVEEGEDTMFEQGRISAFEDVKVFINHTLEVKEVEVPVSKDLEEAAEEWDESLYRSDAFIAGAQWQKQQMIDKACEWQRQHMKTLPELLNKDLTKHTLWKRDEIIDKFRQAMEE